MAKIALITGITGQDGRHLAEFLLDGGYEVHGTMRRVSYPMPFELDKRIITHIAEMGDQSNITSIVHAIKPDEVYNLAAMSDVYESFSMPEYTIDINGSGIIRVINAVLACNPNTRIYQASTSEMFGNVSPPQNEKTPLTPRSPYAASKVYAYHMSQIYRKAYGVFVSNGIMFNHESTIRGHRFVTRKITRNLSRIKAGLSGYFMLGNLDAKRDWGHAKDYVRAQWMILQHPEPDDFVVATGESHSVREFITVAARYLDMELEWQGMGVDEYAVDINTGEIVVGVNPDLFRPIEVEDLRGDASKARAMLGWKPTISFDELVKEMVEHDLDNVWER